jgi:hypothetical protein
MGLKLRTCETECGWRYFDIHFRCVFYNFGPYTLFQFARECAELLILACGMRRWQALKKSILQVGGTTCILSFTPPARLRPSLLFGSAAWVSRLASSTRIGPNQPFHHQMSKQLKSARTAIDKQDWNEAKRLCHLILQEEANYNAFVFLGVAEEKLLNVEAAIEAYNNAIALNSDLPLAHQVCIGHSVH